MKGERLEEKITEQLKGERLEDKVKGVSSPTIAIRKASHVAIKSFQSRSVENNLPKNVY